MASPDSSQTAETLESQFKVLLDRYARTISQTSKCGSRGQSYIDSEHEKLVQFGRQHPEFSDRVPPIYRCRDDGCYGASGIGAPFTRRW